MRNVSRAAALAAAFMLVSAVAGAAGIDPVLQAKLDARMAAVKALAADPVVVEAVKAVNATARPEYADMTQEKWVSLSVLDPLVRPLTRNDAANTLKTKKADEVSEAFVSAASGVKVAFLSKPTNWSHKGKPKHDVPMTGKTWQGEIEMDESTGVQQIQVSVPVLEGGKPIGSLVVGFAVAKLR